MSQPLHTLPELGDAISSHDSSVDDDASDKMSLRSAQALRDEKHSLEPPQQPRGFKAEDAQISPEGSSNPPPDVRYVLAGQPTGWAAMAETVRAYDEEKVKDTKEDIDTLLVFVSDSASLVQSAAASN